MRVCVCVCVGGGQQDIIAIFTRVFKNLPPAGAIDADLLVFVHPVVHSIVGGPADVVRCLLVVKRRGAALPGRRGLAQPRDVRRGPSGRARSSCCWGGGEEDRGDRHLGQTPRH